MYLARDFHPARPLMAELLAELVHNAVAGSTANHPVDLANAAGYAVEYAGETIDAFARILAKQANRLGGDITDGRHAR